jgi:single-stranded-DNA-specific exonuclease
VDCGTSSHDPIKKLNRETDLIILDHHVGSEQLPDALAIINPNRQDELTNFRYLCAAGVVFLYLVAVTTALRNQNIESPDLIQSLDLVALATVADVVPLTGLNRAFVQQGLKIIRNRTRPGLKILADISKINSPIDEYHIGFLLAPKLNAAGRIGDATLATKLLSTDSEIEAQDLAEKLELLNKERQAIGARVEDEALKKLNKESLNTPIIFVSDSNWHPGVIGIVASKIKERTNRPSFVITFSGGIGKGSGRSIPGVDLGSLMQKLAYEGLIEKGGGHSMAAGITLSRKQLKPAFERLLELIKLKQYDTVLANDFYIDGILLPKAANLELIKYLAEVGPFGSGAPQPRFVFPDQNIIFCKRIGTDHLKVTFCDDFRNKVDAVCFRAFSSPLGIEFENHLGKKFHIAGKLVKNTWQGREKVQVIIDDAAEVQK